MEADPEPWDLARVAGMVRVSPRPSGGWASHGPLPPQVEEIFDRLAEVAHKRPALVRDWETFLAQVASAGSAAVAASEQHEATQRARATAARGYAAALPASYAEQAGRHVTDLDGEGIEAAIQQIVELGERAHEEARARLAEAEASAARVESLAHELTRAEQAALRARAIAALAAVDVPSLLQTEEQAAEMGRSRRVQLEHERALVEHIRAALGEDDLAADALLAAAALACSGDLEGALAAISRPPSAGTTTVASEPQRARPSSRPPRDAELAAPLGRLIAALNLSNVSVAVGSFSARNRITHQERFQRPRDGVASPERFLDALAGATEPALALAAATQLLSSRDARFQSIGALHVLAWRGLEEARRESVLGIVEHALDLLKLVATGSPTHEGWGAVALALLGFEPAPRDTKVPLDLRVQDSLEKLASGGLSQAWAAMLAASSRDTLVSERLVFPDLRPFAVQAARGLFDAAANQSEPRSYVLEDVARGLMIAYRDGDRVTAGELLAELATCDGASTPAVDEIRRLARGGRGSHTDAITGPEWVLQALRGLRELQGRQQVAVASPFVGVPKSVAGQGGFYAHPGSGGLEFALYVSNPRAGGTATRAQAAFTELLLPASRNPRVLTADIVVPAGTLWQDDQFVVPLRIDLPEDADVGATSIPLQYQVRWCDGATGKVFTEDRNLNLPISRQPTEPVRDYSHVDGRPLVLGEEQLKLSSDSVVKSLAAVRRGLAQDSLAALLTGRRRRGKTSILETVKADDAVRERYLIIFDIREDLPFRTYRETLLHLGNVLERIPQKLGVSAPPLTERLQANGAGWNEIQRWIEDLTDVVPNDVRVLLLIDEFQKWVSAIDAEAVTRVLGLLRGLFNRPSGARVSFSIVLSGLTNLDTLAARNADFKNAFRALKLRPFNQRETDALVRSNDSIEFDTRAIAVVRSLSGGNPFLVNLIGSMIASALRDAGRSYCLPEDVERVVENELRDEQSRVRSFVQYLLRKGEENHAAEVEELPTLIALAYVFREHRGTQRYASVERIIEEMRRARVEVEEHLLREHLASCVENELLATDGVRYGFATEWLERWLRIMYAQPVPIVSAKDPELVLTRYRIRSPLGSGGQAQVYEADDTRTRQKVILKIYARTAGVSSLARAEIESLMRIDHSGVVRCRDWGTDEQKGDVVVLDRLEGKNLRWYLQHSPASANRLIGRDGDLRTQVTFLTRLAQALSECHRAGIVHRDIKPENIVVGEIGGTSTRSSSISGSRTSGSPRTSARHQTATHPAMSPPSAIPVSGAAPLRTSTRSASWRTRCSSGVHRFRARRRTPRLRNGKVGLCPCTKTAAMCQRSSPNSSLRCSLPTPHHAQRRSRLSRSFRLPLTRPAGRNSRSLGTVRTTTWTLLGPSLTTRKPCFSRRERRGSAPSTVQ